MTVLSEQKIYKAKLEYDVICEHFSGPQQIHHVPDGAGADQHVVVVVVVVDVKNRKIFSSRFSLLDVFISSDL